MEKFCPTLKNGDNIGLLLEFEDGVGTLNFFNNGGHLGKSITDIAAGEYFPCLSLNHGKNSCVINSSAKMPTKPYPSAEESRKNAS